MLLKNGNNPPSLSSKIRISTSNCIAFSGCNVFLILSFLWLYKNVGIQAMKIKEFDKNGFSCPMALSKDISQPEN
jgi:hypothetical protein